MARMAKKDEVTPFALRAIIPDYIKNAHMRYTKIDEDMKKTVVYLAVNVYNAKDENGIAMISKHGNEILNKTIYVAFKDGTYTTLKNDIALSQVCSVVGDIDVSKVGTYGFILGDEDIFDTKFVLTPIKMGKKSYDYWVFDPQ